jgi:transposase-like protein
MLFLRKVLAACTNKPVVLVDEREDHGIVSLGSKEVWFEVRRLHITFGERNTVERLFRTLKERTRRFYNNINARVNGIDSLILFLNLFMLYYNNLR